MSKIPPSDKNGVHGEAAAAPRRAGNAGDATREQRIARLAYEKSAARGFLPGHEMDDWLEAEAEVDGGLAPHLHAARPAPRPAAHRQ